jgi:RNA-directed DNA polymerase
MSTTLSSNLEDIKERFYKLKRREDIAELLEISDYQLRYNLYIFPRSKAYKIFKIPKKSGDYRQIHAPVTSLKIIQRKLNHTEGKTDVKHLNAALIQLHKEARFTSLKIDFGEDIPEERQGSTNLLKRCEFLRDTPQQQPIIAIFDRDEPNILNKVHDDAKGFKEWGNGVYSFAIPVPKHREPTIREVCIEFYYKDEEIKRPDSQGRRLFLSTEFDKRTCRHLENKNLSIPSKSGSQLKIIDSDVYNEDNKNVALSKNSFAENILANVEGFNNFNFIEFTAIFEIVEKILLSHKSKINS